MKKNEQLRFIISIGIAIILITLSIFIATKIMDSKKTPVSVVQPLVKTVYVDTVKNQSLSIKMIASGSLEAYRKVELYAEVQGILQSDGKLFKAGESYLAGNTILHINDSEFAASIVAQRSTLYNLIMSALPDLQLDYPKVYPKWQNYLNNFDLDKRLTQLPSFESDKEKYFISSRSIVSTFYNIRNLEEKHSKYQIKAPFNGVVTEALVNNGTLIRAGQKLGEFIDPSQYELGISLRASLKDFIKVGNQVQLINIDKTESYSGSVTRINNVIDPSTQSIQVFIEVNSSKLSEGLYLEAQLEGQKANNVFELPRKLIVDNKEIFTVANDQLKKIPVNIIHFTEGTAIIKDLPEGTIILQKNIPGAYDGMLVNIAK